MNINYQTESDYVNLNAKSQQQILFIISQNTQTQIAFLPMQRQITQSLEQPFPRSASIRSSLQHNKTRHLIDYLVEEIGLSERIATILVKVHQCTTKADILQLLTSDDNDTYRHIFIPNNQVPQRCQICDTLQQRHVVIDLGLIDQALQEEDQNSFSEDFSFMENPVKDESSKQLCEICYMKYNSDEMAHFSDNRHSLCIACLGAYIDEKITSMQIESIYCPHCGQKLSSEIIKKFASERAYLVYEQFLKNAEIQKNPNLMWCPNPKCSVVISIHKKKKNFSCPKCSFKICSKCKHQAHEGKSCNSVFEKQIKSWQNSSSIQRCKKCSSIVQKISGCNHMSCTVCGHEWCWLCGANYSQRHFNPLNPFGCAGMQNRDGIGRCRIWLWRIALFILMCITVPIAFPFALLFSGPFVAIEFFYKKVQYGDNRLYKVLAVIFGFLVGIMFDPIIWIGLVVVFGPRFFGAVRDYFRNRRRRMQNSENRLTERLINDAIVNSENIVFDNSN